MRKYYDKLIRDRIPEIIKQEGRDFLAEPMQDAEFNEALLKKLIEESEEAVNAETKDLIVEIVDLYEIIDALIELHNLSREDILSLQEERRNERGGYKKKLKLIWVE
jgi:predicted house-cleaning noncanonical NTP pyrophosphatase (MazG superfamily)